MKQRYHQYKFYFYRYAPESFLAYRRTHTGDYEEILEAHHDSTLGNMAITKGARAVFNELKRRDRENARKKCGITYGFFFKGSKREYAFFRMLYTFDTSLMSRLMLYKHIKEQMEKNDWRMEISATAQLGPLGEIMSVTKQSQPIDRNRPCSIRVLP